MQRLNQRFLDPHGKTLLVFSSKVQFHFCVDSVDPFVVVFEVERTQSMVHHPETPAGVQLGHLSKLHPDGLIIFRFGFVANNRRRGAHQFTGLAKADCITLTSVGNGLSLLARP